ncbi:ABC-three component system protein, partial [Pseudorhodoplanes sp.]|uniref:ABC-three component system protein n=1 Tax=Pseudorhodoplanes sp. TaxID=1934341 RepID=UPI003D0EEA29
RKASPWTGSTIIQAKNTIGYNRHFAETDFFYPTAESSVVGAEVPRIRKLRAGAELDNYMLFSNRRLAGGVEAAIRKHLTTECKLAVGSVYLCGVEQLEVWLKTFPDVAEKAQLDPVDSPLLVSPDDLAEIVQALARSKDDLAKIVVDDPPTHRVPYELKNELNNMSVEYAKEQRKRYLKDTRQIQAFLAAPENIELLRLYESVVDEFQLKITARRKDYQSFDMVMEYLVDLLFGRDPILRQRLHKRVTRTVLFYMYWNCDIGQVPDVTPNKTFPS